MSEVGVVSVLVLCVACMWCGLGPVQGEMFTALVHMEGLMELETELLGSLNSYIAAEKQRYDCPFSEFIYGIMGRELPC